MKKIFCTAVAVAVASFLFSGCDGFSKQEVKMSHAQIETHPEHLGLVAFKEHVESKLGDKFEITIYPNATLGANEKVIQNVKAGEVEYLVISSANLELVDDIYSLFSLPYLFTSEDAFESFITDTKTLDRLSTDSIDNGFSTVAVFTSGTRNFYATTPIKTVADIQGKKIRVQAGPANVAMIQAFGGTAVPMSFGEVYGALKNGTLDGAENNELALTDQRHGDIAKYYTYDRHQMSPDWLVASNKFLESLSKEERKVFEEAALIAQQTEMAAWHGSITDAKEHAKSMGVQFIDVNVEDFRNKVLPLHEQFLADHPEYKDLYDSANQANVAQTQAASAETEQESETSDVSTPNQDEKSSN